jgi:serine/threonine-protein kinase
LIDARTLTWKWRSFANVSDRFAHILNTMLSDSPMQRYATAKAVLEALDGEETTIVSQSPVTKVSQPVQASPQQSVSKLVISDQLLHQCEQELIQYIGPVAKFLIQEITSNCSVNSAGEFITTLAQKIPIHAQAVEFQQKLLRLAI